MFNVFSSSKGCPSAECTSIDNVACWNTDVLRTKIVYLNCIHSCTVSMLGGVPCHHSMVPPPVVDGWMDGWAPAMEGSCKYTE
jgi:hypothetical protein